MWEVLVWMLAFSQEVPLLVDLYAEVPAVSCDHVSSGCMYSSMSVLCYGDSGGSVIVCSEMVSACLRGLGKSRWWGSAVSARMCLANICF